MTLTVGSLFTGYGGLDMAVEEFFGAKTSWFSEVEPAAIKVYEHHNPGVPNLGDITKIDWSTAPGVDIMCGGSPCQDMSTAGVRAGMLNGTRSGLWENMREGIATLRPKYVVWENVKGAYSAKAYSDVERTEGRVGGIRALGRVVGDLANLGYDCRWGVVRASDAGAPHRRERVFLLAASADSDGFPKRLGPVTGRVATPRVSLEASLTSTLSEPGTRNANNDDESSVEGTLVSFGPYTEAVNRWITPVPAPLITGRLSPDFTDWTMGLSPGYTKVVENVAKRHTLAGNGVVPQQALLALELLTGEHCD